MFINIDTRIGRISINTDLISSLVDEDGKTRIRMDNGDIFYADEELVPLVERISKGKLIRTEWSPSPSG